MALLSKLKELIGLNGRGPERAGRTVPVEREPGTESERAVKESASEPATGAGAVDEPTESNTGVANEPVDSLSGIGPTYSDRLAAAGVETVGDLADADAADLHEATDIGQGRLAGWIQRARDR